MFKVAIFSVIFSSFLFGDFQTELDEIEETERYYRDIDRKITQNNQVLNQLFDRNLDCLSGTQKMLSNQTCYLTFLAIQDVQNSYDYGYQEKKNLITILASKCPDWEHYEIEDCK